MLDKCFSYTRHYTQELSSKYEETGDLSYILEATILNPSRENLLETNDILLENGEYRIAEIVNHLLSDRYFPPKAAEAALFNFDYSVAEQYLEKLEEGESKSELLLFKDYLQTESSQPAPKLPLTGAGKLLRMAEDQNFTTYMIDNDLGEFISNINQPSIGKTKALLLTTANLSNFGYHNIALRALSKNPATCNLEYYQIKAGIYVKLKIPARAVQTIEEGLSCNPASIKLLSAAVEYNLLADNNSKADYYRARINYLGLINN
jgi:hypothetical protein